LLKTSDILIVNKPAGLPVHGSYSIDTLLSGASAQLLSPDILSITHPGSNSSRSLSFTPGPLHRLDKDTTGVLCFSRTLAGAQWFSQCLREKTVGKYYLGIVRGAMQTQLITAEDKDSKTLTQCYSIGYRKDIDASLMLFRLITGKKHQIRKHSMGVGHPLAGDRKYRGEMPLPGCTRYQLHAWQLFFPASRPADIPAYIEAPLFPELEKCLTRYFPDWREKASAILTNQTQATGSF
jgi:Pseudouridylate synthases, 23S RNA-specific